MQAFIDSLIAGWGFDPAKWPYTQFVYLAFMGVFSFAVINFAGGRGNAGKGRFSEKPRGQTSCAR